MAGDDILKSKDIPVWISALPAKETNPDDIETILFRRAFNCSTDPVYCPVIVHSATTYKLYVNGRLISFNASVEITKPVPPQTFDIREVLTWGENIIAVEVLARQADDEGRWRVPAAEQVALCLTGQMHGVVFDTGVQWKCLVVQRSGRDGLGDASEAVTDAAADADSRDEDDSLLGWRGTRFDDSSWQSATILPAKGSFPRLDTAVTAPRLEVRSLEPAMSLSHIGDNTSLYSIHHAEQPNDSAIPIPPRTRATFICRVPVRQTDGIQTDRFIDAINFASLEQTSPVSMIRAQDERPVSVFVYLHILGGSGAKIHLRLEDTQAAVTSQQRKKKTSILKVRETSMQGFYTEWEPFFARTFAWARLDVTTAEERLAIMKFGIREIIET